MKLVREHISFKRGVDPRAVMDTGVHHQMKNDEKSVGRLSAPDASKFIFGEKYKDDDVLGFLFYLFLEEYNRSYDIEKAAEKTFTYYKNTNLKTKNLIATEIKKRYGKDIPGVDVNETINFERGLDPRDAMGTGDKLSRKFRLNLFKEQLFKYNVEKNLNMEDYEDDFESDWHYYYDIGEGIGVFIGDFYPYLNTSDPEWGSKSLPTDPEDEFMFHPRFASIINDWLKSKFPKWEKDDISQFWEGITDHMRYR